MKSRLIGRWSLSSIQFKMDVLGSEIYVYNLFGRKKLHIVKMQDNNYSINDKRYQFLIEQTLVLEPQIWNKKDTIKFMDKEKFKIRFACRIPLFLILKTDVNVGGT